MNGIDELRPRLDRYQWRALLAGGLGGLALLIASIFSAEQVLRSYLFAYMFWISFPLGCLALLMLHHMVSGAWGYAVQRCAEAAARTLPLMALLFLPILLGAQHLYPWAGEGSQAPPREGYVWAAYLNRPFFTVRAIGYFIVWCASALLLSRWSSRQDRSGEPGLTRRMRLLSAPGMVLYVLTVTAASIDWVMSLEPGWSSTIYGFLFVVGQVLSSLALVIVLLKFLSPYRPLSDVATPRVFHHLGNLLLTFVILWGYMAYAQYIIIWSGNLPSENSWYLHRFGGWNSIAVALIVVEFFLPFFLLLSRRTKRAIRSLSLVAIVILIMRVVDLYWLITPSFYPGQFHIGWLDIAAPVGVGGIWIGTFIGYLKGQPLLARYDPRFPALVKEMSGV